MNIPALKLFSSQPSNQLPDFLHFLETLIIKMQCGRRTALPAVCRLSLTGSKHFSHCWPLPARVQKQARGVFQTRLNQFTNSEPSPDSPFRWPERSFLRKHHYFLLVRVQVWAPGCSQALHSTSLSKTVPLRMRPTAMPTLLGMCPKG